MTKVKIIEARQAEVDYGSHSKDAKRNYLGFIFKKDIDAFVNSFVESCKEQNEEIRPYRRYHTDGYDRLSFSYTPLIAEILELNKGKAGEVAILFEKPIMGYEGTRSIYDEDRLMVFVGFNVCNKALTRFRKFLLNHILDVQKETLLENEVIGS